MTSKKELGTMTTEQLIETFGNKSKAIRALNDKNFTRGEIAKMLGIRYQHVRNVLITPLTSKATSNTVEQSDE